MDQSISLYCLHLEQLGLECLFDSIDALHLRADDDDLNLDYLLEDDDWSQPASSIDGALSALTFEL